jgi:hypothetical protein
MSTTLVINGTTIEFPSEGEDPNWGETVERFAIEVADSLSTISNPQDVLLTSVNLTNNQTSPANINGLRFSKTEVLSATMVCQVYITTSDEELQEQFNIILNYKPVADEFSLAVTSTGDESGITFSVTSTGQVQYTSTNIAGTDYSGVIKFKALTITQ